MKTNKITNLILLVLFISSLIFLHFITYRNCQTFKIFKATIDFGTEHIQGCFSQNAIKKNLRHYIKTYLDKSSFIYKYAVKYKHDNRKDYEPDNKIFENFGGLNNTEGETLSFSKSDSDNEKTLKYPFIKGLINSEFEPLNKDISKNKDYEYNNWFRSHGGNWNTKYDSRNNINKKNIKNLKLAWKHSSIKKDELEKKWKQNIELNPVFINKKLIFVTADWKVVALNSDDGSLLWELQALYMPSRRGILVENNKKLNLEILYIPIGNRVYKINANNGKRIKEFGKNGSIAAFTLVAPMIYEKKLVVVNMNVNTFDINSGKIIDTIPIHLKKKNFGGGIPWGGVALDSDKGIVYANTGNPHPAIIGINRKGKNKRSASVVAIDLNKRKVLWDFQETAHDLWDFDIPSPPIIHNLKIDKKIYEVVISVTKTGNTIILERNTGKPIFDITYKKAPKSKIPGEITAPFQIDLKKPEKFSKIEFSLNDIDKLSLEKQEEVKKLLKNSKYGWYETPSFEKDLVIFGLHGGAEWAGAAIDPINQYLYIPVNNVPWKLKPYIQSREVKTVFPKKIQEGHKLYLKKCSSCHGKERNGLNIKTGAGEKQIEYIPSLVGLYEIPKMDMKIKSLQNIKNKHVNLDLNNNDLLKLQKLFRWWDKKLREKNEMKIIADGAWSQFLTSDNLPASNPPWGYISKLDLVSGKILWNIPVGNINIEGKKTKIGTVNYGGLATNSAGVLFFTGTEDSKAYAFDANTGEELWSYEMEAAGSAPPIIFNHNKKQYVSFLSTGGIFHNFKKKSSTIYTFTIPE
jgi:quinoprotein glucose dehydrogenase